MENGEDKRFDRADYKEFNYNIRYTDKYFQKKDDIDLLLSLLSLLEKA